MSEQTTHLERIEECISLLYSLGGIADSLSNIPETYNLSGHAQNQIYSLSKAIELMAKEARELIEPVEKSLAKS